MLLRKIASEAKLQTALEVDPDVPVIPKSQVELEALGEPTSRTRLLDVQVTDTLDTVPDTNLAPESCS